MSFGLVVYFAHVNSTNRDLGVSSQMNIRSVTKNLVVIFCCVYIIAGILNFGSISFCDNDHTDFPAVLSSFGTYILFTIITETEVFLIRDTFHLQLCFSFWAIHLLIIIISLFWEELGLVLFLVVISPSIGILNTFTGEGQTFIFPVFCFIEAIQITVLLLWNKYAKQRI